MGAFHMLETISAPQAFQSLFGIGDPMNLTPAIEEALDRFALEQNITRDEALAVIAEDWLIGYGYLSAEDAEPEGGGDPLGI